MSRSYNTLRSIDYVGLYVVILFILYSPLSNWILHFDMAWRIPFAISIVTFVALFKSIIPIVSRTPFRFYVIVAFFQFFNGIFKESYLNYSGNGVYLIAIHLFLPILTFLLTVNAARRNFDFTLKTITFCLFLYSILCCICSGLFVNGRTSSSINANEIALYSAIDVGLFFLCYIRRTMKGYALFLVLIPITTVVITASRMGIIMSMIVVIGTWILHIFTSHKSVIQIVTNFIFLLCIVAGLIFIICYSEVGERLKTTTEQAEQIKMETGTVLDYYGDRGGQYYFSWPYFKEHPITGLGISNWGGKYNPTGMVCHSEYLVQYLEGGIVSFTLYLIFWIGLLKFVINRIKQRENNRLRQSAIIIMLILISIIFANSVLWTYDMHCVFVIYALALSMPSSKYGYKYR